MNQLTNLSIHALFSIGRRVPASGNSKEILAMKKLTLAIAAFIAIASLTTAHASDPCDADTCDEKPLQRQYAQVLRVAEPKPASTSAQATLAGKVCRGEFSVRGGCGTGQGCGAFRLSFTGAVSWGMKFGADARSRAFGDIPDLTPVSVVATKYAGNIITIKASDGAELSLTLEGNRLSGYIRPPNPNWSTANVSLTCTG